MFSESLVDEIRESKKERDFTLQLLIVQQGPDGYQGVQESTLCHRLGGSIRWTQSLWPLRGAVTAQGNQDHTSEKVI